MSPTADDSPWREWRQAKLRELLPPAPAELDQLLRVARDDNASGYARAEAIAMAALLLQRWFEEFATVAYGAEATDGLSPEEIMDAAARWVAGGPGQPAQP